MTKTKGRSEQTRHTLLQAALLVFYKEGVSKATIKDIVEEANVTRGAFYWHFKNKEDLLKQLSELHISRVEQIIAKALSQEKVWEALGTSMKDLFHAVLHDTDQRQFNCIMFQEFGQQNTTSILRPIHENYHSMWKGHIYKALDQGKKSGELPENLDIDWAFVQLSATFIGLMELLLGSIAEANPRKYVETVIESSMQCIASAPVLSKKR